MDGIEAADHAYGAVPIAGQPLSVSIIPQLLDNASARNYKVTNDNIGIKGGVLYETPPKVSVVT